MGNSFETPETNVKVAALNLLRHKMLVNLAEAAKSKYSYTASIKVEDVNEVMLVAGLPLIIPEEINVKEVKVIKLNTEES